MFNNKLDLVKVLKVAKAILEFLTALIVFVEVLWPHLHIVLNYPSNRCTKHNGHVGTQI